MKLLIKIFFQTTCIILLASSGIFLYTTYCWKNQSIQNINSYESSIFRTNILQFENKTSLSDNQKQNADNEMRPQIVTYAFRQVFHDSAVLYLDGKMTYNGTVYEFDVKKLRELCASKANMVDHGSNSDGHGPMISQINGRTLLLFYYGNVNMGYQIVTYKDITDVIEKSHLLFFQTGGFTLSLIVVMGIILYLSLRKITAPLTGLREATLLVSEGIYDFKVPSEGNTELAQIGATFNFMTGKIKEQIESLSNINRTQKQLIGSLAHELKTPMTAIIGYADTLLTVRLTPERQEKALIYIENECRRLSRLSMKMLELTGLYEASEDSFNPAEIQVDNFLKEVKELIDCRLQEKNISLDVFCEPKELVKKFDQDLMISVVTNLIDNAVKASRKESKIVLEATPDHLMVQDFGKGIPKEDLEMVTEPFYMVDKSRSRAKGSVKEFLPFHFTTDLRYFTEPEFQREIPIQMLEQRYANENAIWDAAACGNTEAALKACQQMARFTYGGRFFGSLYQTKIMLTVMNTLLRKAIERSNIHPYYIDEISSRYASMIENMVDEESWPLVQTMVKEYCAYVRRYSLQQYSPLVQKVINTINLNLSDQLSPKSLAAMYYISPSYLSSLFKQDTGTTLTDFINTQRIQRAANLLSSTEQNISVVAEQVGILDVNYFTKMFKKSMGSTPTQYRRQSRAR